MEEQQNILLNSLTDKEKMALYPIKLPMKTLTIQITYTHTDPIKRAELAEELEEVCEQYGATISINDEY